MTDRGRQQRSEPGLPSTPLTTSSRWKRESGQTGRATTTETKGLCRPVPPCQRSLFGPERRRAHRYSSWYHAGQDGGPGRGESGYLPQVFASGHYFDMAISGYRYTNGVARRPHHVPQLKYYFEAQRVQLLLAEADTGCFSRSTPPEMCRERSEGFAHVRGPGEIKPHRLAHKGCGSSTSQCTRCTSAKGFGRKLQRVIAHAKKTPGSACKSRLLLMSKLKRASRPSFNKSSMPVALPGTRPADKGRALTRPVTSI